jgi:hypothetical protein
VGWQWVGWFGVEELFSLERNGLDVRVLPATGITGIVLRKGPPKDAFGGLNVVFIRVLPATGITGIVLRKAPPKDAFGGTNGVIAIISTIRSRQFCVIEARTVGQEEFGR